MHFEKNQKYIRHNKMRDPLQARLSFIVFLQKLYVGFQHIFCFARVPSPRPDDCKTVVVGEFFSRLPVRFVRWAEFFRYLVLSSNFHQLFFTKTPV